MVKADMKHNYYADLELPSTASIEDVRKAYRKLALQYHPDRNSGREEECVPKFQAIQAAIEVLGEPASKQKYDTDRKRFGINPLGQTFNPRQPGPGNPYGVNTAYPPPPRRTQPGTWQRPQPNGADRFSNFPKPAPTARHDPAQDTTNKFKAWQYMNPPPGGQSRPNPWAPPQQPQQPPQPQAQRAPRPQPPPRNATEEQTKAGMRPPNAQPFNYEKNKSAWETFNQANMGRQGMARNAPPATPRRQGFNPNMPGSDEKPADAHYFHRKHSDEVGRSKPSVHVPPPPSGPPPTSNPATPTSPLSPKSRRPYPDPTRPYSGRAPNDQVPYAEGNRDRTPYTSYIRERTDLGDGLRRAFSTRDTTKLGPEDAASQSRARSTSPLRRQRASESHAQGDKKKKGFDLNYSSSEASENSTPYPDDLNKSDLSDRPGTAPTSDRPKKIPTPPSSRFNATRSGPTSPPPMPPMPSMNGAADGAQSEGELPGMQQKANSNMYASNSFISSNRSLKSTKPRTSDSVSTSRARRTWSGVGRRAIPSSVNPFFRIEPSKQTQYVTAADELFKNATEDEQRAFLKFQGELQKAVGHIPDNFDMEVFLNLASTARQGTSCGNALVDQLIRQILFELPTVGYSSNSHADKDVFENSFKFSHDPNKSTPTNAKARSEENINMQFSSEPVTSFGASGAYDFAPPPPTGRKGSPIRRSTRTPRDQSRAATMDVPTSPPATEYTERPWGSMGLPKDVPSSAATGAGVSQDHWESNPFSFPPHTPQQSGNPTQSGAASQPRNRSQGRRTSKALNRDATPANMTQPPHVVDEDDTVEVQGMDGAPEHGAPVMNEPEPMDIDNTPPAQNGAGAQQARDEARLYNVPRSRRQEQEQKQHHVQRHRKTSNASRKPVPASAHVSSTLKTNLDDLRHVEPISKSADATAGLSNFGDLTASLPIQSQAASKIIKSNKLSMPAVPKAPAEPTKLTKSSWPMYVQGFGAYVRAFHDFNKAMIEHFAAREQLNDLNFKDATRWLEAAGDTSGLLGAPTGFGTYLTFVEEDEQVREHWNVGCDMHTEAIRAFGKVRERVRKLVEGAGLADN